MYYSNIYIFQIYVHIFKDMFKQTRAMMRMLTLQKATWSQYVQFYQLLMKGEDMYISLF